MAHHIGRARLTSALPPNGPGKTPPGGRALPVGCHTRTIIWTELGRKLRRHCSVPPGYTIHQSYLTSFKRELVSRVYSHIQRTHIIVMRRCHSLNSLISRRHSQTHFQRHCLGHTSFSMYGDRRVYTFPHFQPGIGTFIRHPSRTGKMTVYRAPCICTPIHRDTTTSMAREPSAKPPHPPFFGIAKRRTSSRCQSKGRMIFTIKTETTCPIKKWSKVKYIFLKSTILSPTFVFVSGIAFSETKTFYFK